MIDVLDIHTNSQVPQDAFPQETVDSRMAEVDHSSEVIPDPNPTEEVPTTYAPFLQDSSIRHAS